jgi:hypothetical protein
VLVVVREGGAKPLQQQISQRPNEKVEEAEEEEEENSLNGSLELVAAEHY